MTTRPSPLHRRRALHVLPLEARMMFDAAAAGEAVQRTAAADAAAEAASHPVAEALRPDTGAVHSTAAPVTTLVFVDTTVSGWQQLAAAAPADAKVVTLTAGQDPWAQMTTEIAQHQGLTAVHLLSHGNAGQLIVGGQVYGQGGTDLNTYATQFAAWQPHLTDTADILLYGCDVAAGPGGTAMLDTLARLTRADVAGSTDLTGSTARADWVLEAATGSMETTALSFDRATWDGELATTVYNAAQQSLTFDGTTATRVSGGTTNPGTSNGDVVRFHNVITLDGQVIDALVTTTLSSATVSAYDHNAGQPSSINEFFQPNISAGSDPGSANFNIQFVKAGTTDAVTLQNVVVNSYDLDGQASKSDRQYQVFKGFARYELATTTQLVPSTLADGSVKFLYTTASPTNNGDIYADPYRVRVYYDSISTFDVQVGIDKVGASSFSGIGYFAVDFSLGNDWTGATTTTGTPAANITYDTTTLTEAGTNDGAIGNGATITLTSGSFTGTNGQPLSGVTVNNVPAGLTAVVTRVDATHATLTLTGQASSHANANDINNLEVVFGDAAFTSSNASVVTGATRSDLVVDFSDPAGDTTAPAITGGTALSYAENQASGAVLGTVTASDAVGVTGWRFASTGTATSSDGYFAIDNTGQISLTSAGAAAGIAANDYETAPNSFTHAVQAGDAAGNWSAATDVTLAVTNLDDTAPTLTGPGSATGLTSAKSVDEGTTAVHTFTANESVTWSLDGGADAAKFAIDASGRLAFVSAPDYETPTDLGDTAGNNTYVVVVKATDAAGNVASQTVTVTVTDVDETAPVTDDTATLAEDTVATGNVLANDHATGTSVVSFSAGGQTVQAGHTLVLDGIGSIALAADGSYTFTPAPNWSGTVPAITYHTDAGDTATLHLSVTPANDAPALDPGTLNTGENTPWTGQLPHGTDADGDTLSYGLAEPPAHGTVALTPDGHYTYTPVPGYVGTDRFQVQVSDGQGGQTTAWIEVTVTPTPAAATPDPAPAPAAPARQAEAGPAPAPVPEPAPKVPAFDSALRADAGEPGRLLVTDRVETMRTPAVGPYALDANVGDIYTRPSGFRTMVTPEAEPSLKVFRGLDDQVVPLGETVRVQVPADTFVHTKINETVTLHASLADGRPLPRWLSFDGRAGTFTGDVPENWRQDLVIRVLARDSQGREAMTMMRLKVGEGRSGLSRQLIMGHGGRQGPLMAGASLTRPAGRG